MGRLAQHEIRIYCNGCGKYIMTEPEPGSKEAIDQGCICPVNDNQMNNGTYWLNKDCPLHGFEQLFPWRKDDKTR
jgi:hypothetical protein